MRNINEGNSNLLLDFFSSICICFRIFASRAPRGSSRRRIGSFTSARVMATRFRCCPPESRETSLFRKPSKPTIFSILVTFWAITSLSTFSDSDRIQCSLPYLDGEKGYFLENGIYLSLIWRQLEISIPLKTILSPPLSLRSL